MFIRIIAVDNIALSNGGKFREQLINVNDIFLARDFREPDGQAGPYGEQSIIELRGVAAGSEYPRVQLYCKESIDDIEAKIQRALARQRGSVMPSRRQTAQ